MKHFLLFFLGMTVFFSVKGQSTYAEAIRQGDEAFDKQQYKTAINKYFAAEAFDPSKKEEVKKRVQRTFDQIEALRDKADKALKQALESDNQKRQAIMAQQQAEIARTQSDIERKKANSARETAEGQVQELREKQQEAQQMYSSIKIAKDSLDLAITGLPDSDQLTRKRLSGVQENLRSAIDLSGFSAKNNVTVNTKREFYDLDKLKGLVPENVIQEIADTALQHKLGLNSPLRLAHFLAQCAAESNNFSSKIENLNYPAKALINLWPGRFPTPEIAEQYAKKPEKIGNKVYANRLGNGDEASGDGYKFRGRGYLLMTGKTDYVLLSGFMNEDFVADPDLVANKYPLTSAGFFFSHFNLWPICDKGAGDDAVIAVTKRLTGGLNGLENKKQFFQKFYTALTANK